MPATFSHNLENLELHRPARRFHLHGIADVSLHERFAHRAGRGDIRHIRIGIRGAGFADAVRIQYGGSMKPENAAGLMAQADVDGGLIGGAALKPDSFLGIVKAAL